MRPGGLWRRIRVVAETGSTNADLDALAREGAEEGVVLVAEAQTAGRGRLDRRWTAPPGAGLTFSVLLRPAGRLGWVPLLAGVAVVGALRGVAGAEGAALKWPNDVLIGERKLGGILAERVAGAVVIGIGLNVSQRADELPIRGATSLALEGAPAAREPLLRSILRELAARYADLGDAEALRAAYVSMCATLGRRVRVELPDGSALTGRAGDVDEAGRLVVDGRPLSAGDVVHVR